MTQPVSIPTTRRTPSWPAIGAAVVATLSALTSLYWALGGRVGLATVGGSIEELARSGGGRAALLVWATVVLKAIAVLLALTLVRPWGARIPRILLLLAGGLGAVVLVAYGAAFTVVGALALTGVLATDAVTDRYALTWHVLLWDPIFLLWGLLLGAATLVFRSRGRPQPIDDPHSKVAR